MRFSHDNTRLRWPGVVFLATVLFSLTGWAQKPKATFTLDLPMQSRDNAMRGLNGMQYVRPGQIAVWYSDRSAPGSLSRRDKLNPGDPWQLKMQVVGTGNGAVVQRLQWPTRKNSSGLVVVGGKPILLTGPEVHCFTPDFRETRKFTLRHADEPREARALRASPGGTAVWALEASGDEVATRIDANSCTSSWSLTHPRQVLSLSGNDNLLVDTNPKQVGIYSRTAGWQLLLSHECCLSQARFVAQDLIAVIQLDINIKRHLLLVNLKGEELLDDPLDQGSVFGDVYTSTDGKTAAVTYGDREIAGTTTGIEIRKSEVKIHLYDLMSHKRIGKLQVSVPGEHLFAIAISPDSSELALLNGNKLSMYELRH